MERNSLIKKRVVVAVILLFIGMSVIPSTGTNIVEKSTLSFDGNTLYVGGDGTGNYIKIQDAIDNASDRDTVFVYDDSSPYYENVVVDKSIMLIGEDKNTTIIDANISGLNCIDIYADNVTVTGFTTKNSNFSGIGVVSINNIITDNIIKNNSWFGVYISGVSNDITYNIISNNGLMGIRSELSNQIIIGNEIINNHIGVSLCFGSSIVIYHNNISGNNVGIQLIISTDTTIMENNFFNNKENAVFHRGIILEIRTKLRHEIFFKIFFKEYYDPYYKPLSKNSWCGNYWNESRISPKPIYGSLRFFGPRIITDVPFFINWVNFDWHPALQPYDIPMRV